MKILDLGCGSNKTKGALGLDQISLPGVDVVHDLNRFPYPFEENAFDKVVLRHVVEHIENVIPLMEEIHRIAKPGALVEIDTPHFTSSNSYSDPTHLHHFSLLTFDFFCGKTEHDYLLNKRYRKIKCKVFFWPLHDKLSFLSFKLFGLAWLAERHPIFFERFLCFFFPLKEFRVQLEVMK